MGFEVLHGEYEDHSSCILNYRHGVPYDHDHISCSGPYLNIVLEKFLAIYFGSCGCYSAKRLRS